MKKYALYPGTVRSKSDGDQHYITADQLCRLYGVRMNECMIVMPRYYGNPMYRQFIERAEKLIPLRPRYSGDYTLPTS